MTTIIVDTEDEKQAVIRASNHIHDSNVDMDIPMVSIELIKVRNDELSSTIIKNAKRPLISASEAKQLIAVTINIPQNIVSGTIDPDVISTLIIEGFDNFTIRSLRENWMDLISSYQVQLSGNTTKVDIELNRSIMIRLRLASREYDISIDHLMVLCLVASYLE